MNYLVYYLNVFVPDMTLQVTHRNCSRLNLSKNFIGNVVIGAVFYLLSLVPWNLSQQMQWDAPRTSGTCDYWINISYHIFMMSVIAVA